MTGYIATIPFFEHLIFNSKKPRKLEKAYTNHIKAQ